MKIRVGLVDDHQLFRKSVSLMLRSLGYEVVVDAGHGKELQEKLTPTTVPDIMLIDVEMPVMNGVETARWLKQTHPTVRLVALSMNDKEHVIMGMIRVGCCSYLLKDIAPDVLDYALREVYYKNYYNSEINDSNLGKLVIENQNEFATTYTDKELEFLNLACTDLTYKQIGTKMKVSERTVDGLRESLFSKLNVVSRTGMVMEGMRKGFIKL
ncbi:MAG: response regulator transcription factor [Cyclobacteriaceae bacterium]|nr:response regulator transcription factor [Cyclobacteriaceae bacterium]